MVKQLLKLILHLVIIVIVIVITYPLWFKDSAFNNFIAITDSFKDIKLYSEYSMYEYGKDNSYLTKSSKITIRNQNGFSKYYKLTYVLEDNKLLNKDNTYIKINDTKTSLKDLDYDIKDGYLYILLDYKQIDKYTTEVIDFSLLYKNYQCSNLISYFIVE